MNMIVLQGKTENEAIMKAEEALNAKRTEFIYTIKEEKGKLFKGTTYTITACTYNELVNDTVSFLKKVINNLGLTVNITSMYKDEIININMESDNNPILIGKNGQTLKALETLLRQRIYETYNKNIKVNLDVSDYKIKRINSLERLAIKLAKEVKTTKMEVALDNMNSYERRIIHNKLSTFKGVKTISEGEEPNRHVIIKPAN